MESRVIYQVLLPSPSSESSSFVFEQGSFVSVGRDSLDLRANPSMAAAVSPRYQLSRGRRGDNGGLRWNCLKGCLGRCLGRVRKEGFGSMGYFEHDNEFIGCNSLWLFLFRSSLLDLTWRLK